MCFMLALSVTMVLLGGIAVMLMLAGCNDSDLHGQKETPPATNQSYRER